MTSLTFFGFPPLFFLVSLSLCLLFCLSPLPPSYVRILSRQLVNRLELLSAADNTQLRSAAVCGRRTSSPNVCGCEGWWSFRWPLLMTSCRQKPHLYLSTTDISLSSLWGLCRWQNRLKRCKHFWNTARDTWPVSYSFNSTPPFFFLQIHETYFLSPPSPSTSLHLTFYLPHFAINLLFILSNELIRVS